MSDPIVVAVIAGLVALVVAGLSNFGAESFKRHRDTVSLAAGLAGELASHAEALPMILKGWGHLQARAEAGEFLHIPKLTPTSPVYESSVARLGALGPELVEEVAFVYGNIQAFRMMMLVAAEAKSAAEQATAIQAALFNVSKARGRVEPLLKKLHRCARAEFLAIDS
jgi:hypothetical protein